MKIKITESNLPIISGYLATVNGRASAHTISAQRILLEAKAIENNLADLGLNKKQRSGAKMVGRSGGKLPASYKYTRVVNNYSLIRGSRDWFLTSVTKCEAWGDSGQVSTVLTPKQDEIAVSRLRQKYWVDRSVALVMTVNKAFAPLNPS